MSWAVAMRWLGRRAENLQVLMLAVMFSAFILQIVFRYFLNLPTGWTSELTLLMWVWMVLWGAAFVLREEEEIRFDLLTGALPAAVRRILTLLSALALIGLYLWSLPAAWDYITFMKRQDTAYLNLRFDYVFSIYALFSVGVVGRYIWLIHRTLRDRNKDYD